jgi:parvulin-like peptidyl-prolyl isomerase
MAGKDAGGRAAFASIANIFLVSAVAVAAWLGLAGRLDAQQQQQPQKAAPKKGAAAKAKAAPAADEPKAPDLAELKVMAVVNGHEIARQELANECLRRYGKDVLESMLNKHLILDACKRQGVTITQKDVDDEIRSMAEKFGLSLSNWLALLKEERNITPEQYAADIVWPMLALKSLVKDETEPTQEELEKAWETEFGAKVEARMIAVKQKEKADQLRALVAAQPEEFARLAKDNSEDYSAAAYGVIPPIRKNVGDPEIEKAVFKLKPGEISPVIFAAEQYLIFKCEKQIPPAELPPEAVQAASERVAQRLRDAKMRAASAELFRKLQDECQVQNVMNDPELSAKLPGVAATVNGKQIPMHQLAEECLKRHGKEVLEGEINRHVLTQELVRRKLEVTQTDIDKEIARAAENYGFVKRDGSNQPDIDKWMEHVMEQGAASPDLYIRDAVWPTMALKKLVAKKVSVTGEDLRKGFEANYGERVEVLAIVLGNQRDANKVFEMARGAPTDREFGDLAEEYSIEPVSRANKGKVPPIRMHGGQPTLEEAAFNLKPGELSGIIVSGDRYILLRCLGRTKPIVQEFEDVKDELHKDIHEKKLRMAMAEEFDRLKEGAQIDNFLEGTSQPGAKAEKQAAARPRVPAKTGPVRRASATEPARANR